uniref:Rhodanese domain-containing protein n=1 Tax=Brassica campestris TaxID=3711 RepID=M4F7Y0_BRACM
MAEGGNRVPSSVSAIDAHELLQAGHRYLDVRTPEEFSQGHATGAINVPYMNRGNFFAFWMSKNPNFLEQVSSHFGKGDEVLVGCQSGGRSLRATAELLDAGFTGVKDISGGYSAWAQNGLPTQD